MTGTGETIQLAAHAGSLKFRAGPSLPFGCQSLPMTMPWTRHVGFICCRITAMPEYAMNAASSAFCASQGEYDACALERGAGIVRKEREWMWEATLACGRRTRPRRIAVRSRAALSSSFSAQDRDASWQRCERCNVPATSNCALHQAHVHLLVGTTLEELDLAAPMLLGYLSSRRSVQCTHQSRTTGRPRARRHAPGVPSRIIRPETSWCSNAFFSPMATATPDIAIKL